MTIVPRVTSVPQPEGKLSPTNEPNSFENLARRTLCAMGYAHPTPVQELAFARLANGESVHALAPTGSGKTLAFLIPLMAKLNPSFSKTQLLVLAPTRELCEQIATVARLVAKAMHSLNQPVPLVRLAVGGVKSTNQKEEIQKGPAVIIATPGRILDFARREVFVADELRCVVLDEADLMLGMGFVGQIESLAAFLPSSLQTALFSATESALSNPLLDKWMRNSIALKAPKTASFPDANHLSEANPQNELNHQSDPNQLGDALKQQDQDQLTSGVNPIGEVSHFILKVEDAARKHHDLVACLRSHFAMVKSGIVFCQTREGVQALVPFLQKQGFSAEMLSGDLGQIERSTVLRRFRAGGIQYLVATNLASRGIDIFELGVVVNFDIPANVAEYVHRAGRTGRAGKGGEILTLCDKRGEGFLRRLLDEHELKLQFLATSQVTLEKPAAVSFTKIFVNRGKTDKLRPGDFLGALLQQLGLEKSDVGNIFIFDHFSHIEVNSAKTSFVVQKLPLIRVKNKSIKASLAED